MASKVIKKGNLAIVIETNILRFVLLIDVLLFVFKH